MLKSHGMGEGTREREVREGKRIIYYPRIFVTKHGGWGGGEGLSLIHI